MSTVGNWRGPNIVKDGLVFYIDAGSPNSFYPLTAGTTWKDIGGNNRNGTLTNGPVYSTVGSGSIFFDGSDDYVVFPSVGILTRFTVDVWVYATSLPSNFAAFITDVYTGQFVNFAINYNSTAGSVTAGIFNGSLWNRTANQSLSLNTWTNFTMTYNGSQIVLHKNGIAGTPLAYSGVVSSNQTGMRVARRWDQPDYFAGNIPTVKIYSRALTASEINQNFQATRARFGI